MYEWNMRTLSTTERLNWYGRGRWNKRVSYYLSLCRLPFSISTKWITMSSVEHHSKGKMHFNMSANICKTIFFNNKKKKKKHFLRSIGNTQRVQKQPFYFIKMHLSNSYQRKKVEWITMVMMMMTMPLPNIYLSLRSLFFRAIISEQRQANWR